MDGSERLRMVKNSRVAETEGFEPSIRMLTV
jgi:hypothetical protein